MNIESLRNFHNMMIGFDPNEVILVIFNNLTNTITYYQNSYKESKTVVGTGINYLYKPKNFRYGILTPEGYQKLLENINLCINSGILEDDTLVTSIDEPMKIKIYNSPKNIGQFNPGPQLFRVLEFVTFTNPIIVRFILYFYSPVSKLLLKRIKYDKKHKDDVLLESFKSTDTKSEKKDINNLNKRN